MSEHAQSTMPTFIVVGAPRCGTTSLHYYLRQHPQVCMSSVKEPNFFLFGPDGSTDVAEPGIVRKSVTDPGEYARLFDRTPRQTALGEISPLYLYVRGTAERIAEACGDIPIICLVRNPAERAWSHHVYASEAPEDETRAEFAELVRAEMAGGAGYAPYRTRTHLLRLGRYHDQIAHYHQVFGSERVLTLLSDDLDAAPADVLARVTAHIGVEPYEFATDTRYNAAGRAPSGVIGTLRRAVRSVQPRLKAVLPAKVAGRLGELRMAVEGKHLVPMDSVDPEIRAEIIDWCREDIERLAELIGRDLSGWLTLPG